jgi:hypothetical protein
MTNLSDKTVCVFDNGLFVEFAVVLAKSFGRTYLHVPWTNAYPKSTQLCIGAGLEGIEKIDSIWPLLDKIDLFVFPDVYDGPLQAYLRSIGKRVWGSGMGEELELFRDFSKKVCREAGLDVGPYRVITGMDALRKYLKSHDDQYVKISRSRGDFETFKSETYQLAEPRLDEIAHRLGALSADKEFIVEKAIPDAVEVAYDGYCIDGKFPPLAMSGVEIKDKGYLGKISDYKDMAEPIRIVNEALAKVLNYYQYRNFISLEFRVTKDGTPWVIDPCCRAGSPPSELQMLMYGNLAEIMWHGADGEVVDPEPTGKWGAQCMMVSQWATKNWQAIDFPKEIRENVKLHYPAVINGRYYNVPQDFLSESIGAVVAVGDTMDAAIKEVKKLAEQVRGYYVEIPVECFDDGQKELKTLKEFGLSL